MCLQVYSRLNHLNMCVSYSATLRLIEDLSRTHTVPLDEWIKDGAVFKFWGDNVDKNVHVRDLRSDNQGSMVHMFSLIVGRSRTPAPEFPHHGQLSSLLETPEESFLPNSGDVTRFKSNLVKIVSRTLTRYISGLAPFAKIVPKHIIHQYSRKMSQKSDVFALDVLLKRT